jgi:transcriptional regulator with XRE-family HTH domain
MPPAPPGEWLAVGERIVQARKRAGLEQRALAARLGISPRHLRNIENGTTNPLAWIAAVADATTVDGDWIHHGGLVMPGELEETARALREALAAARDDREALVRATESLERGAATLELASGSQEQLTQTQRDLTRMLEALLKLLADRLGPPPERE